MKDKINGYIKLFRGELLEDCVPFWLAHGRDLQRGGIYTCLDRKGNLFSTDKSVWMQGRCAWMFSRLCNQYGGKEEWLRLAKSCIDFLNAHCIDNADGRMFFTVTEDGRPLRKRRYYFSETFYIMANAEYAKASGDVQALKNAQKYYDFVLNIYADPSVDPYKITPKVIDSTRKSRTLAPSMILLNVSAVMRECDPQNAARYDTVSKSLAEDIVRYFYKPELGVTLENVGYEGEVLEDIASFRVVNPGHSIEMSWFLLDEAIRSGNSSLAETAEKIFNDAFAAGWDGKYGGLLYFTDYKHLPVEAYEHDMKLWWPHNEAVIAALKFYSYTGRKKYFDIFETVFDYAEKHFHDKRYGEWYGYLRRDGVPTEPACKGQTYKGPFHVLRMYAEGDRILSGIVDGIL